MNGLNLKAMARCCRRPSLNATASVFWRDPYISAHVLHAHLDAQSDAGSRMPERITEEARWVVSALDMKRLIPQTDPAGSPCLFDLGCGPGLYAREFSRQGLRVVGYDVSPASIEWARRLNRRAEGCTFHLCDFTRAKCPQGIHGAAMIYGVFGTLSERQRDTVLRRLWHALPTGGRFVFDVFSESWARRHALTESWYYSLKNGFWMPEPHLVLERSWFYDAARTVLNSYHVLDAHGVLKRHLVRHRWYEEEELSLLLERHGFVTHQQHRISEEWLWVTAEKSSLSK